MGVLIERFRNAGAPVPDMVSCGSSSGRSRDGVPASRAGAWNSGRMAGISAVLAGVGEGAAVQLSHTLRVVTSALDGDVLAVPARAQVSFTGRELAQLAGASKVA